MVQTQKLSSCWGYHLNLFLWQKNGTPHFRSIIYIYTHTVYTPNVNHGLFFLPFDILGVIFLIDYRNSQFCGMFTLIFEDLITNLYQVSIYPLVIWSNNIKHGNGKSTERWIPIKTVGFPSHDLSNSDPRNVYKLIRPERGQVDMHELDPPNFGS